MIHVRPPFLAVYVRAGAVGDRTIDEQVRLALGYVEAQRARGRWADDTLLYYLDPVPPGRPGARDGMERLLDDVWAGSVTAVVTDRLERLGDSPRDAASTISLLDGVRFVLVDDGIDARRPAGALLTRLLRDAAYDPACPTVSPCPDRQPGLRVGMYARVSTRSGDYQAVIDAQVRRAADYLADQRWLQGWEVVSHEVYADAGASGRDADRPGFRRLEQDITAGKLDVVVCRSLDRLSRELSAFVNMMDLFEAHQVRLIALRDEIDTGRGSGSAGTADPQ